VTTGPSGPGGPTPSKRNPAIIIAAIIGVLALGIGAFALTQSGGSKSASSDSSVPSSDFSNFSDSTDFTDSGSLTESDAQSAAEDFARTLFTFDSSTISSFKDNLLAITTGALHDEIDGESASFSTDVQSSDTSSVGNVTNSSVLSFDPSFAIVSVDISLTVSQSGSTAPDAIKLTLVVNLDNVDGTFLASAVANCSSGSGSDLSLGFTNSDAEATC
jgi:hypothetical protein